MVPLSSSVLAAAASPPPLSGKRAFPGGSLVDARHAATTQERPPRPRSFGAEALAQLSCQPAPNPRLQPAPRPKSRPHSKPSK